MKYNKKQIEESIIKWSGIMLENNMIDESELKTLISEGLLKRTKARIGQFFKKTVKTAKDAAEAIHDVIKPNKGAKMLIVALDKLSKKGINPGVVKMFASMGEEKYYPIVDFKVEKKKNVILIVNPDNSSAQPKNVKAFRELIYRDCGMKSNMKITDVIESISLAKINDAAEAKMNESFNLMFESKLSDYIEDNNLSKDDALKDENIKKIKKLTKQNDTKTKEAIEKYFAKKDKDNSSSADDSDNSDSSSDSSSFEDDEDLRDEDKKKAEEEAAKKKAEEEAKPKFIMLDNQLLDVIPKKTAIGFKFSKTKAEIDMDYAFVM